MCALFEIGWDATGSKGELEFVLVSVFCLVLHIAANMGSVMLAVFVTNPLGGLPGGIAECGRGVPRRGTGWRSEVRLFQGQEPVLCPSAVAGGDGSGGGS